MLLLQHGDGPGGVGENCFTPEFDFGVVWIRGFDAVQAHNQIRPEFLHPTALDAGIGCGV